MSAINRIRPKFQKTNTIDHLFSTFYGFQAGRVLIEVMHARDLIKNHPLVEVEIDKMKAKTQTVSHELFPKWNEEFVFDVKDLNSVLSVDIINVKRIGKSRSFGHLEIKIKDLIEGDVHEGWHTLKNTSDKKERNPGEIYLKVQYLSATDRNIDYNLAKKYSQKIMDLLIMQPDIIIIATLCRVYESEELSKTVIRIFNSETYALRLLIQLIFRDLKLTNRDEGQGVLFRNDTMATKTSRNYFKMIASLYLRRVLEPLISEVKADCKGYEIDPKTILPGDNLEQNQNKLEAMSQKFLDSITASISLVPMNMRRFFSMLRQLVKQCFPESELRALGGFFFLRFMCPAIISPEAFQIIEEINDPECRRALTLIAKVLQNLANDVKHFKEEKMQRFDIFLEKNHSRMNAFYEELSTVPASAPEDAARPKFSEEDRIKALSLIMGQIHRQSAAMEKILEQDPRIKDTLSLSKNREDWETLKQILSEKKK